VAVGRVVISNREHMVAIQPYDGTLLMIRMRAANEVRAPEFRDAGGEVDDEAVSLAGMIIEKRAGTLDPNSVQDRYQDALRNLVEETAKGHNIVTPQFAAPAPVIDLMAALKRSLAEAPKPPPQPRAAKGKKKVADRRQRNLMLPVKGGKTETQPVKQKKQTTAQKRA